ncbi:TPM domain-containing protein [Acinetobacter sp. S40]|uniref:TPM domain-containing protein n=1 Tax=Acinetobacter sp. S40 TaxID=2767434 RepID=UPI00190B4321|nr:TPM domain-containing protein [Acinetobacter sp. S40]MBJ9984091.1 TPM domain-containing protein [Acinetobacter sp. S40]
MVTKTDTTQIITQPKLDENAQPSFKRWLKHAFYFSASKHLFSKQDQLAITNAVKQAEHGHVGEIQVVIEGHIPCSQAYYQNTRRRAEQLFGELGVWDTEYNSGILLYLNLCERQVEIVIDRGICALTHETEWQAICLHIVAELKAKNYRQAVINGVLEIGEILDRFYDKQITDSTDELDNSPIILN